MNEYQYSLVTLTLQTFVEIEQRVGEVWETIAKWFPHSEIEGACSFIAAMEKSVHAFFYQKMNDVLSLDPEEIVKNQQTIKVLKEKLSTLEAITSNLSENKALSLFTISMIEQVLLFSNFALLKSFKANGYNLIQNTLVGVDFVTQDETLHGLFAGALYKQYLQELKETVSDQEYALFITNLLERQQQVINEVITHEDSMIDYIFAEVDSINSVTADQMKTFIRSRANDVITSLNINLPLYPIDTNPIADWFYKGVASIKLHDFFVAGTNQYRRNWKTENLSLKPFLQELANE